MTSSAFRLVPYKHHFHYIILSATTDELLGEMIALFMAQRKCINHFATKGRRGQRFCLPWQLLVTIHRQRKCQCGITAVTEETVGILSTRSISNKTYGVFYSQHFLIPKWWCQFLHGNLETNAVCPVLKGSCQALRKTHSEVEIGCLCDNSDNNNTSWKARGGKLNSL